MIRQMIFNGVSTGDLRGVTVAKGSWGTPKPRVVRESVPYCSGSTDLSAVGGKVYYDDRDPQYVFNVIGKDAEDTADLVSDVINWLYSEGDGVLKDEHLHGWKLTNCRCTDISYEYIDQARRVVQLTAAFAADPYMISEGAAFDIATFTGNRLMLLDVGDFGATYYDMGSSADYASYSDISISDDGLSASVTLPFGGNVTQYAIPTMGGIVTAASGGRYSTVFGQDDDYIYLQAVYPNGTASTYGVTLTLSKAVGASALSAVKVPYHVGSGTEFKTASLDAYSLVCDGAPVLYVNGAVVDTEHFAAKSGVNRINVTHNTMPATLRYSTIKERL